MDKWNEQRAARVRALRGKYRNTLTPSKEFCAGKEQEAETVQEEHCVSLSPAQVKNWREALCMVIGPYALVAPEEQIDKIRKRFQTDINKEEVL